MQVHVQPAACALHHGDAAGASTRHAALPAAAETAAASEAVKTKIRQIIGQENPKHPYSDQKIVELLKDQTIDIARRTVAKYREQLGILSSSKRKQLF